MIISNVGVSLVHWNSGEVTIAAIRSLIAANIAEENICVADNGSSDNVTDIIASLWPQVYIIRNHTNAGFAHATNQGLSYFFANDAIEYFLVINNDTEVHDNTISQLLLAIRSDERIAAVSPKILYPDKNTIWYGGAKSSSIFRLSGNKGKGMRDGKIFNQCSYVEFLSGCCMLISRRALKEIGYFDESLGSYCEDNDWCERAKIAGYRMFYDPSASIIHHEAYSVKRNRKGNIGGESSSLAIYLISRNQILICRRYVRNPIARTLTIVCLLLTKLARASVFVAIGRKEKARSIVSGTVDGFRRDPKC